jgi:tRNA (mo5U34)-methyltransferase
MDQTALIKQINELDWVHSIDLGNGIVTPGKWPKQVLTARAFDDIDFRGKKVLDIGCWDGLWAFEAEKRGAAEIFATDYISQRSFKEQQTFLLAHKILQSKVKYYPNVSVFNIGSLGIIDFDIVLFLGVYYHLRDPLLAFARLRQVIKEGGTIVVGGDVIQNSGRPFARFYYHNLVANDASNWWVPTTRCLHEWIESSFFTIVRQYSGRLSILQRVKDLVKIILRRDLRRRYVVTAVARIGKDPNYVFPDDELKEFDRNN